jgi:hypothetical protein
VTVIYRRVVSRTIGDQTTVENLECGHAVILYRQVRAGRVTWSTRNGQATGLSSKSRECETCATEAENEAIEADRRRRWLR